MGVDGIVAPRIDSAAEANQLADKLQYPPTGSRGFAPRRGIVEYPTGSRKLASDVVCLVQIESQAGLDEVAAIVAVDAVDGLVVGTADLSFALGGPLELESAPLVSAVSRVGIAAERHGKAWGIAIADLPDWVADTALDGASLLVFSSDIRLYGKALDDAAQRLSGWVAHPQQSPGPSKEQR